MKLARSSFYYKPRSKSPDQMKAEADLRDRIETICLGFPRYGYRRVTYQLKREGKQVNHKKVLKIMRESDLLCRVKRKRVKTTNSRHRFPRYPNLIKGMVHPLEPGMAFGYHLHPHPDRLCLPGSYSGRLLPEGNRIRCFQCSGYHSDASSAEDSHR